MKSVVDNFSFSDLVMMRDVSEEVLPLRVPVVEQAVELVAVGEDEEGLHQRQQRLTVATHGRLHRRGVALDKDQVESVISEWDFDYITHL